jgi:NAD(P)-dependent dehydrogenase (short-subunit alcohol dehydrogenase family)
MTWKTRLMLSVVNNYVIPGIFNGSKKRKGQALAIVAGGVGAVAAARMISKQRQVFDLRGKTVLITGGSRGLGLVMAREFVAQGAQVAICARDLDELERATSDLVGRGGKVFPAPCDLTIQAEVEQMIRTIEDEFGVIDVLVNNAGVISVGPVEEMTLADFEEAMKTNYWAALYATLAVLPGMRARRAGRIVNIASIGGKISVPHLLPYSVSKFALVGLSTGLRAELAKDKIVVTTVCPGLMRTGSPRNATFKGQNRAEYAWFSISDSLPLISMSAERAARQIIRACKHGVAEVVLTVPARLAVKAHAAFPGMTTDLLAIVNHFLPGPGGIGERRAKGKDSESTLSPSLLTKLGDEAAHENNQFA